MWRESLQCVSVRRGFLCNANHFTRTAFFLFQYNSWNTFAYLRWTDMQITYLTSEKVHLSVSEAKNVKRPPWMKYGGWIRSCWQRALRRHDALWAPIPPLHYASLCLNSTPTQKHVASHPELAFSCDLFASRLFPTFEPFVKDFFFFFNQVCANEKISPCTNI